MQIATNELNKYCGGSPEVVTPLQSPNATLVLSHGFISYNPPKFLGSNLFYKNPKQQTQLAISFNAREVVMFGFVDQKQIHSWFKIKRKVTKKEKGRDKSQRKWKDFVWTQRHGLFFKRERRRATKAEHMCCCNFSPELFGAQNLGCCPGWNQILQTKKETNHDQMFLNQFFYTCYTLRPMNLS